MESEFLNHDEDYPAVSMPSRKSSKRRVSDLSPIREDGPDIQILPRALNAPPWLRKPKNRRWADVDPASIIHHPSSMKFIDDGIHMAVVNMRETRKEVNSAWIQSAFDHIVCEAQARGMHVNANKTSLINVSAARSFEARAAIYTGQGKKIESKDSLKILGYTINADGGNKTHISNVCGVNRGHSPDYAALDLPRRNLLVSIQHTSGPRKNTYR